MAVVLLTDSGSFNTSRKSKDIIFVVATGCNRNSYFRIVIAKIWKNQHIVNISWQMHGSGANAHLLSIN